MSTPRPLSQQSEGWTDFGGASRKFHYLPADDDRALCGKWGVTPFVANARALLRLFPDEGESSQDCKACRRKRDATVAKTGKDGL
jgi:hypothetical protein